MGTDDKVTESRPVDLLRTSVVAIGDSQMLESGVVARTPGPHEPDFVVTVVPPLRAISIRFANIFLIQLVGLLIAGMSPVGSKLLYTSDFLHLVGTCASLSLPGAGLGLFKDLVTIFGRLEQKYPLLTGNV